MELPNILLGTFQVNSQFQMNKVVEAAISSNIKGFDTAPSYGNEKLLGNSLMRLLNEGKVKREEIFIQTKIDAIQMYYCNTKGLHVYVNEQIDRLSCSYIDALLIHWPFAKYIKETWNEMLKLKKLGLVKHLGICNLDERGFFEICIKNGLNEIEIIQNEISPLNTSIKDTLFFQKMGFLVEAYSPFCRMNPLITSNKELITISNKYGSDIGRLILQWHIDRGIHPIFASQKKERIISNSCLKFHLLENEIEIINSINQDYKIFPISHGCPGY